MHFILEMVALYDSGLWTMEVKELDNKELESPVMKIDKNSFLFTLPTLETTEFDIIALF